MKEEEEEEEEEHHCDDIDIRDVIILICKIPTEGQSKTRLISHLGLKGATNLAYSMLKDVIGTIDSLENLHRHHAFPSNTGSRLTLDVDSGGDGSRRPEDATKNSCNISSKSTIRKIWFYRTRDSPMQDLADAKKIVEDSISNSDRTSSYFSTRTQDCNNDSSRHSNDNEGSGCADVAGGVYNGVGEASYSRWEFCTSDDLKISLPSPAKSDKSASVTSTIAATEAHWSDIDNTATPTIYTKITSPTAEQQLQSLSSTGTGTGTGTGHVKGSSNWDLGRILAALYRKYAPVASSITFVGGDTPHLPAQEVCGGILTARNTGEAYICPSSDGGYVLLSIPATSSTSTCGICSSISSSSSAPCGCRNGSDSNRCKCGITGSINHTTAVTRRAIGTTDSSANVNTNTVSCIATSSTCAITGNAATGIATMMDLADQLFCSSEARIAWSTSDTYLHQLRALRRAGFPVRTGMTYTDMDDGEDYAYFCNIARTTTTGGGGGIDDAAVFEIIIPSGRSQDNCTSTSSTTSTPGTILNTGPDTRTNSSTTKSSNTNDTTDSGQGGFSPLLHTCDYRTFSRVARNTLQSILANEVSPNPNPSS